MEVVAESKDGGLVDGLFVEICKLIKVSIATLQDSSVRLALKEVDKGHQRHNDAVQLPNNLLGLFGVDIVKLIIVDGFALLRSRIKALPLLFGSVDGHGQDESVEMMRRMG